MATKEEKLVAIHDTAKQEFNTIQSALRDERLQSLQDRRFYSIAGAQWEGRLGEQFENKPKFEVNKIHLSVIRIINEYRNNRITVDFLSKDGRDNDKLANVCDGLYRADEDDSNAEKAYDNAFEEAVGGGFGAWRLRAEYEDDEDSENEKQRIKIEPIYDADSSVFFDLNAKRQDKSDAKHCFVLSSMTPTAYEAEFGESPATWNKEIEENEFDWNTPTVVYVAEYYREENKYETYITYEDISGEEKRYNATEFEEDLAQEEKLIAIGSKEVRRRKVKTQRIHKYIMNGNKVIEDCGLIAGKYIPIVPTYGKRWFIDNVERCMGHVRLAKDAQRLKNMQLSKLGEISALSTVQKPILTPEQIAGHENMWTEDNIKNYPYLLLNPMTNIDGNNIPSGPMAYTQPPVIPPAMAALLQITETDMQDVLGNPQGADKMVSNISGEAVAMIQKDRLDIQTYIYMSNMAKAIKRSGEIWLCMAKDIFVEPGRQMKTVGLQGEVASIELTKAVRGEEGELEYENDLSKAKFDITVAVGPSSSTKRTATLRAITNMMQASSDPETMQVLSAMAMLNMEGEGIEDVRGYFRKKLLKMGAIVPTEEEREELLQEAQNTPPNAQEEFFRKSAEEAEANAKNKNADTLKKLTEADKIDAQTEQTKAETIETITGIQSDKVNQALNVAKQINESQEERVEEVREV